MSGVFDKGYEAVLRFNDCAGLDVGYDVAFNKFKRVVEEVKETQAAFDSECDKELLDGAVDILYTTFGFIHALENLGFDVVGAFEAVCKNNDTKLIEDKDVAEQTAVMYEQKGIPVNVVYNKCHQMYVVKNKSEGKVLKPVGYESVVLDEFLPKGE